MANVIDPATGITVDSETGEPLKQGPVPTNPVVDAVKSAAESLTDVSPEAKAEGNKTAALLGQPPAYPATPAALAPDAGVPTGPLTPAEQAYLAEADRDEAPAPAPAGVAAPTSPDLSGLAHAEKRVEAANNAKADLSSLQPAADAQSAALGNEGKVIEAGGKEAADVSTAEAAALAKADEATKAREAEFQKNYQPLFEAFQKSKIDPDAKWKSMGFGGKALAIIGQAMGAFASGYTGRHNDAADIMNNAIEQNIAAQRANLQKDGNALQFMREQHIDDTSMDNLARLSMREQFAAKLAGVQSKNLSAQAQARLGTLDADNKLKMAELKQQLGGTAAQENAGASYALEATKATLAGNAAAAGAAAKPAKPEDIRIANKAKEAIDLVNQLYEQVGKGYTAMPGAPFSPIVKGAEMKEGSETSKGNLLRRQAAIALAEARAAASNRPVTPESIAEAEDQLPGAHHADNQIRRDQLINKVLTPIYTDASSASFGLTPAPPAAAGSSAPAAPSGDEMVLMSAPGYPPHRVPRANVAKAIRGGWRLVQ